SLTDESWIPTSGKDLIIVAAVGKVLHFRIFDRDGKLVVNTAEKRLTQRARQIEDLRKQLVGLWPPHELTGIEQDRLITAVASIVGHIPADDIQEALKLAPDDPEVLLNAAVASEQIPDAARARAYFEKGVKKDPKNVALALGLARLETGEKQLAKAEDVLRQALKANPVTSLAFELAQNLILQGKIEGKDGAAEYVVHLRKALRAAGLQDVDTVTRLETAIRYLEAEIGYFDAERSVRQALEIDLQRQKWRDAKQKIEMARALSGSDPHLLVQLDLMLADCHARMGDEEQRLDALRRAAEVEQGPDSARKDLADALARSGRLDQAVTILLPITVRKPEWRLDLARLLLQKAIRQPREPGNWRDVEWELREAEKALPQAAESITLLRLDALAAQGRVEDARSLLSSVQAKEPRNLQYRLSLARLTQRQGKSAAALQILDQAEKDLGPSLDLQLARLDYWGAEGGVAARAEVAKLAQTRQQIPAANQPRFLERLGSAEIQLGESSLGRQHWRELAALEPNDSGIRLKLLDLSLAAGDHAAAASLVAEIRKVEGDEGTTWRFAQAALLIDKVRRGESEHLDEARGLAETISEMRPKWALAVALRGDIEELAGSIDKAIGYYLRAVELGNVPPSLVRRLVGLLNERKRFDEIAYVARVRRDQGAALDDITIVRAFDAIRRQDFDQGIALAREVFPDSSTNASDHLTLGRVYMAAGRSDQAGKEFRRAALELGRGLPECWLTYVQYLAQTKHIDQARAAVREAGQALPADRSTLALAECWLLLGDVKQAEDLVGKVLRDEGKSAEPAALRLAAKVALSQNRFQQVQAYLDKLGQVTDLSASDRAWVNRTRVAVLLNKGRPADVDSALALVQQNLRNDPASIEDQVLKATILYFRPAERGEAVAILQRLAVANTLGNNERFLLAQLYLSQHDDQKYQGEMVKLLDLKVRSPQHLADYVTYWIGRNQLDQADRWLAELKKAEPQGLLALELEARLLDLRHRKPELLALLEARGRDVPDQIGSLAALLNRYGFAREAETAYKAFVAREPGQPQRALVLAAFLAGQGRHPEAMTILRDAWNRCPHDAVALAGLDIYGSPSAAKPEKAEAAKWLFQAAGERPDDPVLTSKLGFIYCQEGDFDKAEQLNRQVLIRDPDNAQALNNLANLMALHHNDRTAEALGLINRAIAVHGPHPTLLDTRAVVRIRAGQSEQAIDDLRKARDQNPRNVNYALHLAWAHQAVGKMDEARGFFRRAVELGFQADQADALERSFIEKLRQDLSAKEASVAVDRKS
ncbi:MAG: tetratricopeptide repeat protein, partial [Isosphaeraceae bacterium]